MEDTTTGGNSASADAGSSAASAAPTTFAEAFAADASPTSDTALTSTTTPAAEQPGTDSTATPQQTDERSPFIPRARFDEVNTRKGELESKLSSLAWAEQVNPQEFQQIQRIAKALSGPDKVAGLQELAAELRKEDPAFEAQLRSYAARTLAQRPPQVEQEPQPDLPIQLDDGRVVHLYSAEQQAKRDAYLHKQWLQSVEQKLQPLQQTHEQWQAQRAAYEQQQQVEHFVTTTFADLQTWPGMADPVNQKAVAQAMRSMGLPDDASPERVMLAANEAYRKAVLPTLNQKAQSELLDSLKTKAAASTSVNPGTAASSAPRRITSFHDAGLQW